VKVLAAEFVTSAAAGGSRDGIPRDGLPQIAMVGRSNVGKSTLLNALCRRRIARTSAAPGKTRLANVYRVTLAGGGPGTWDLYFVDLPGYGYARRTPGAPPGSTGAAAGGQGAGELAAVAEAYLARDRRDSAPGTGRPGTGPAVLLLVDSRHPGLELDLQAARWLQAAGLGYRVVATKIDKLSRTERARNLKALELSLGMPALAVSAASGEGLDALWKMIASLARTGHA
jgi:GTP-binding protein